MPYDQWFVEWTTGSLRQRVLLNGRMVIGRSLNSDLVVEDPYVSRAHCTVEVVSGVPFVDARHSLNRVTVDGEEFEAVQMAAGQRLRVGNTVLRFIRTGDDDGESTLRMFAPALVLRRSTRELVDDRAIVLAQFSVAEFAAFEALALKHPDAASHTELGTAVWGSVGFDQYQLHRLLQRVRQRLGPASGLLENVRGAGYRLRQRVDCV